MQHSVAMLSAQPAHPRASRDSRWRWSVTPLLFVLCGWTSGCSHSATGNDSSTPPSAVTTPAAAVRHQAGFKTWKHAYSTPSQGSIERRVDVWYPTESPEATYDYQPQEGSVASNAPVAPGEHPLILF
jgi:hypothetical protein